MTTPASCIPTASNRSRRRGQEHGVMGQKGAHLGWGKLAEGTGLRALRNLDHLPRVCRGLCKSKELGENADAHSTSSQKIRRQWCRRERC